mmetsp:Transcript_6032/g.23434  ORF Transcript_6032/g.23434 Transcript_6032/m.23434 type:complete len:227 (+) Transcript_6032:1105-1785(+)
MSDCTTWICWFSLLISAAFSSLSLVSFSACFIARCAFLSFSLRNVSKRIASSSSICSLFLSASSFSWALPSSLRISSRFVSKAICTRNISRLRAMNSAMFSFSWRRSGFRLPAPSAPAFASAARCLSASCAPVPASSSLAVRMAELRPVAVDFSHTRRPCMRLRSSSLRLRSSSRIRNTSSSLGSAKGRVALAMLRVAPGVGRLLPATLTPKHYLLWIHGRGQDAC